MKSVFTPNIYKYYIPIPHLGVTIYIISSPIVSYVFFQSSKFNSAKHHYDSRWIVFFACLYCIFTTELLGLMLVYSVKTEPKTAYPFYASLMVLANIPCSTLLFYLAKDTVTEPKITNQSESV